MNIFTSQYNTAQKWAAKIYRRCPFNITMLIIDDENVTLRIEALKESQHSDLNGAVEEVLGVDPEFMPICSAIIYEADVDGITLEVQVK